MSTAPLGTPKVRQWIENVLTRVIEEVAKGKDGQVSVVLRRMHKYEATVNTHEHPTDFAAKDHEVRYSWPGQSPDEAWRFGEVLLLQAG